MVQNGAKSKISGRNVRKMKRFLNDVKKYWKYTIYSARSDLKSEVASSYLNWLWWVLDPLCFMLIYTFMFGVVFNASEPYFPVFIFIGLSMWDFFNRTLTNSVKIVKNNKAIVSKVYMPKYILIFEKMMVNGFKMLVSFGIVVAMMVVFRVMPDENIIYVVPIFIDLFVLSFGLATLLLHFGVFVEDLSNVLQIGLRLLFYITGIFYRVSTRLPAPYGPMAEKYNPLAFLIASMRNALLYQKTPSRKLLLLWLVVGLVISAIGVRTIYKNENSYVKVI